MLFRSRDCEKRGVTVSSTIATELPPVAGDDALLEQAICGVLANAIEAMPDGGSLRLDARAANRGGRVTLTVADSGVGIEPEQMKHLFSPFRTTKPKGMGLGLALVRRIVRRLGGSIRIDSQPRQGTTVTIELARHAAP